MCMFHYKTLKDIQKKKEKLNPLTIPEIKSDSNIYYFVFLSWSLYTKVIALIKFYKIFKYNNGVKST